MSSMWGARAEVTKEKQRHSLESVDFSWFAHMDLYVTHVGAREKYNKRKDHVLDRLRKYVFFVVCPYGSLCHPCGGQARK